MSLIKHWIELGADNNYTLETLQPIYNKYEKMIIKDELDETLPNNKEQVLRVKI